MNYKKSLVALSIQGALVSCFARTQPLSYPQSYLQESESPILKKEYTFEGYKRYAKAAKSHN